MGVAPGTGNGWPHVILRPPWFCQDETMTIGYFTEFQLPSWLQDADCLIELLRRAWQGKYLDFREDGATEGCLRACDEVLAAFGPPTSVIAHRRLVYMCWAMAESAS